MPSIGEDVFDHALTIIKAASDGNVMNVRLMTGGHLPSLQGSDAFMRMQHDELHGVLLSTGMNGGGSGVSRCRHHNGEMTLFLGEDMVKEARRELQGIVLEGKRRSQSEIENPAIVMQMNEWRLGRERAIAASDEFFVGCLINAGCHIGMGDGTDALFITHGLQVIIG